MSYLDIYLSRPTVAFADITLFIIILLLVITVVILKKKIDNLYNNINQLKQIVLNASKIKNNDNTTQQ